jgi:hypothetical protein
MRRAREGLVLVFSAGSKTKVHTWRQNSAN